MAAGVSAVAGFESPRSDNERPGDADRGDSGCVDGEQAKSSNKCLSVEVSECLSEEKKEGFGIQDSGVGIQ